MRLLKAFGIIIGILAFIGTIFALYLLWVDSVIDKFGSGGMGTALVYAPLVLVAIAGGTFVVYEILEAGE